MFEIHVGELRATFLRNHNMRRRKDPKQKTTQADNSSTEDPRNPDSCHNRHKRGGTAPVTWRCTRYVAVHPNRRGALPTDRVQHPNKQEQTRNWHTEPLTATPPPCAPGPYWRQDGHTAHATTCTPAHSDPIRHLPHPYMRRAGKDAERAGARRRREKRSARPGAGQGSASGRWPTGRRTARTRPR